MHIAIYARKSVFREDSISVESQIEQCAFEARGEKYVIYTDNGFSGKNTDRPDFQKMMNDIKLGKISKVIVYKLDRISRSVLDFSEMMEIFQKYNVDFISATEHFDTSSPMGRAMLNICIVFAQLERETIQQRVADAYASRSKRGFYMGGKIPYGYKKVPITIDGVKTSMYEIEPIEASDIQLIYNLYSEPSATLGDVLRELVKRGLNLNRRGHYWNTARLSELMRNPAYTFADMNIYHFFKEQKSNIINSPEEFTGVTSMYLFSGENTNRKTWDLSGQNIVIAPHKAIIDSNTWILCRRKLLSNHNIKYCKPKNSFLAGKVKCGYCHYGLVIRFSDRKRTKRYFVDTGWTEHHCCSHKLPTIFADDFENMIIKKLSNKINTLHIKSKQYDDDNINKQIIKLETEIEKIDHEINIVMQNLASQQIEAITMMYINKKLASLDNQKNQYLEQIEQLQNDKTSQFNSKKFAELTNVMSTWNNMSFDDKRNVIELLISKIIVYSDKIEIQWKI